MCRMEPPLAHKSDEPNRLKSRVIRCESSFTGDGRCRFEAASGIREQQIIQMKYLAEFAQGRAQRL